MDREDAEQLWPIIKAFSEGKTIQSRCIAKGYESLWYDDGNFSFDDELEYRIKPEPTHRPFANAEECWEEMKKHQPFGWVKTATGIYRSIVWVSTYRIRMDKQEAEWKFEELFDKKFTFADGTPFGIKL